MPEKMISNNRGIALLITLTVITVLITVVLELNKKVRSAVISSAASRDMLTLSQMASSGIHAAMAMLVKDKMESNFDSLQEDWADAEKINEVLRSFPFENGKVTLKISDELGKIQVNALVKFPEGRDFNQPQVILWDRFLRLITDQHESPENFEPNTIIDPVKDWLDSGDDEAITGLNGAESEYYQDLDPPYPCRNGPISFIGDLLRIKGIEKKFYHGAGDSPGIVDLMTVYGMTDLGGGAVAYEGRININTAELPVLASLLPTENKDLAQFIYDYRKETEGLRYINDLSDSNWYKNIPGFGDIKIDPRLITASSDFFRIEATATLDDLKKTTIAVVHREKDGQTGKWSCKVLCWEAE
jgi:general secretion pathway protein K